MTYLLDYQSEKTAAAVPQLALHLNTQIKIQQLLRMISLTFCCLKAVIGEERQWEIIFRFI